jgi:hypothetical protein
MTTPEPTQPETYMGFLTSDYDRAEEIAAKADPSRIGESQLAYNIAHAMTEARHAGEVAERERCARFLDHKAKHAASAAAAMLLTELAAAIRSLAPDTDGRP